MPDLNYMGGASAAPKATDGWLERRQPARKDAVMFTVFMLVAVPLAILAVMADDSSHAWVRTLCRFIKLLSALLVCYMMIRMLFVDAPGLSFESFDDDSAPAPTSTDPGQGSPSTGGPPAK